MKVAIIGGGIAGLSAAHALKANVDAERLPLEIELFERETRLGGKILTERVGGFIIEGGPDTFVSTKPWGVDLCRRLDIESRLRGADMRRRKVYVLHRGRLVELPDGLVMMVPGRIRSLLTTPLLSATGKLRLCLDLVLPPARGENGDESLASFVRRRLGSEAYERLIEPLMGGIYAGDGSLLSLEATFPFLRAWELQYGSLTRGAQALKRRRATMAPESGNPASIFMAPEAGLAELTEALEANLEGVQWHLGNGVRSVQRDSNQLLLSDQQRRNHTFDAVIVAAPAFAAASMLHALAPDLAGLLQGIEYVSTATVSLAYPEDALSHPLDGHGYVIPRAEGREALACTWTSTKFPHRSPPGYVLRRVFVGRAGESQAVILDEERLVGIAQQELALSLGIHIPPVLTRVHTWPNAMPQYNLGHPERLRRICSRLAEQPGLFLAGAAYQGIGIPDCIRSGQAAADKTLSYLTREKD